MTKRKSLLPEQAPFEAAPPAGSAPITYENRCSVEGCPHPNDPDWHVPHCKHGLAGEHHHWPKRSQGGSEIAAFLCPRCHAKTDTVYGDKVVDYPDGRRVYLLWQVAPYKVLIERVIGDARGSERLRGSSALASPGEGRPPACLSDHPQETHWDRVAKLRDMIPPEEGDATVTALEAQETPQDARQVPFRSESIVEDSPYNEAHLNLPENLPRERFREIVATLLYMKRNVDWLIGDAIVYGERTYGEEVYQDFGGFEEIGFGIERLKQCARVSERIPPCTRVPTLTWTHHREVCALDPEKQVEMLALAEADHMSSRELHAAVRPEKPDCAHVWLSGRLCSHCKAWEETG